MPHIPEGITRWAFYRSKAHKISPYFPEGETITQGFVGALIPSDPQARLPATADDKHVTGTAVGNWLSGVLPEDRVSQWEELTRVPISAWTATNGESFERSVRHAAGEVLGWQGLVQARATRGIRVRTALRARAAGEVKMLPVGAVPEEPPELQPVWPDCIARIEVPARSPGMKPADRRAWMFADYGHSNSIYTLDPVVPGSGPIPPTRFDEAHWRDERGGHMLLPRGEPGHVYLPSSTPLGTRFDMLVLVIHLEPQPEEIRVLFDDFERRLRVRPSEVPSAPYQRTVRALLDEAASLIDDKEISHTLYRQACEVVRPEGAMRPA